MKKLILAVLFLPSLVVAEGNLFLEIDHYSQIDHHDIGLSMANIGVIGCSKFNVCLEGKLGTPILNNDVTWGDGTRWDHGDLIGGVSLKYKFFNWK